MDLTQSRLNKTEWTSIEIPINDTERRVIDLITAGYADLNIRRNANQSIASHLRMPTDITDLDDYLFKEYFEKHVRAIDPFLVPCLGTTKMRNTDKMKLDLNKPDRIASANVYEHKLIDLMQSICVAHNANRPFHVDYFTLYVLRRNCVNRINVHILKCVDTVLGRHEEVVTPTSVVLDAHNALEKNHMLMHNEDTTLYSHQRDIFHCLRNPKYDERKASYVPATKLVADCETALVDAEKGDDDEVFFAAEAELNTARAAATAFSVPSRANLILYSAPTGTGKTLTPLALSKNYSVLFVCAARHVGLALAKSAISVGRKVAFAFGCSSADDIRLHYSAASVYSTHPRTGKIWKVDNSVGDKVQIMICDVKSYLCAMYYMRTFNPVDNLLTFWDEPTIGLDSESHPLHEHIHKVWSENIVPNVVLSSATLPSTEEIRGTVADFERRFSCAGECRVTTISSHDCKKTIPLIDKGGFSVMPHYLGGEEYDRVLVSAEHCKKNPTLLRYLDLEECVRFIACVEAHNYVGAQFMSDRKFAELGDVTMTNVKMHYINMLINIKSGCWAAAYLTVNATRKPKLLHNASVDAKTGARLTKTQSIGPGCKVAPNSVLFPQGGMQGGPLTRMSSVNPAKPEPAPAPKQVQQQSPGVFITTRDAYTLTDGPTLFLTEDIEKVAKFYLKQSYIPASVLEMLLKRIEYNNELSERIAELEEKLENMTEKVDAVTEAAASAKKGAKVVKGGKSAKKETKSASSRDADDSRTTLGKLSQERNMLYGMIKNIELDEMFVPNKPLHAERWAQAPESDKGFASDISNDVVCQIMAIEGVNDTWKILLLMGIGVFANHNSASYTEIMKRMAEEQKLYLIIASSDYIYGTNYQFCHGYLGKDVQLTQQKAIQSIGRVGRNNIQQTYSVRLRDDAQASLLLMPSDNNVEVDNMNRLFVETM